MDMSTHLDNSKTPTDTDHLVNKKGPSASIGNQHGNGDSTSISTPVGATFLGFDGEFTWLSAWLPEVFKGYGPDFVEIAVSKFADEGFVSVEDLLSARDSGLLTPEYLREVADLRLGHYNRLILSLNNFAGK